VKSNIVLIGFMGTGKTAVGRVLAEKLGKKFVELDDIISKRAMKSIKRIFAEDGEVAFRELEINLAKEVSEKENQVIACGGGIVLNKINIDRLRENGIVVYLTASPEAILNRVSEGNERPLLSTPDKEERIGTLLRERKPYYERSYDIRVNTSRLSVHGTASKILNELKKA